MLENDFPRARPRPSRSWWLITPPRPVSTRRRSTTGERPASWSIARAAMKEAEALFGQALGLVGGAAAGFQGTGRSWTCCSLSARAQQAIKGSVSRECGRTYARARALAERAGSRSTARSRRFMGQIYFHHGRTELDRAGESAAELLRASRQHGPDTDSGHAYDAVAGSSFSRADFEDSAQAVRRGSDHRARSGDRIVSPKGTWRDRHPVHRSPGSGGARLPGRGRQSLRRGHGRGSDAPARLQPGRILGQCVHRRSGLRATCGCWQKRVEEMIAVAAERGFPTWLARGRIFGVGCSPTTRVDRNEVVAHAAGLAELRRIGAKATCRATSVCWPTPAVGRTDTAKGSNALDEAMSAMQPAGERWYEAELHRVRGELVLSCGDRRTARPASCRP